VCDAGHAGCDQGEELDPTGAGHTAEAKFSCGISAIALVYTWSYSN
jgi:hypothetical protein